MLLLLGQLLEQRALRFRLLLTQDRQPHPRALREGRRFHLQVQVRDDGEGVVVRQPTGLLGLALLGALGVLSRWGINGVNGRRGGEA